MLLYPISLGPQSKWEKWKFSKGLQYDFRTLIHTRNSDPNPNPAPVLPNHPSRLHLRPKTPACQSNFPNTRKTQWKISLWVTMKMHSSNTRVCIWLSVSLYLSCTYSQTHSVCFQFVLPTGRHLHPRNYAYVEQDISAILCEKFKQDFWLLCMPANWSVCQGIIMRNLCGVFLIEGK